MIQNFKAYHGTSSINAKTIITQNFENSEGDDHWLGDGIYFFIEGISKKPNEQAEKWAIAEAWNNKEKKYGYKEYSVIESDISIQEESVLDLTSSDGIEIYEYLIECHKKKMMQSDKKFRYTGFKNIDGKIINFARNEGIAPIKVAIGSFYIKFSKERKENINRRIPNSTICAVYVKECITNNTLLFNKKVISDEIK